MPISVRSFIDKGYVPIACNASAGIAWQGEYLSDFWMWNRQYIEDSRGSTMIQTVKVTTLKEAAIRCWKDGWVAVRPLDERLVRKMEAALREHRGLKCEGIVFPDGPFLDAKASVPNLTNDKRPEKDDAQGSVKIRKRHTKNNLK